jgi:hypothetical protein
MKSTGFASMRVTVVGAVWANEKKAAPMVIHKSHNTTQEVKQKSGPILLASQPKGWLHSELIIKWICCVFPLLNMVQGECIVCDSCRAHISKKVEEHCRSCSLELIVIPGGIYSLFTGWGYRNVP